MEKAFVRTLDEMGRVVLPLQLRTLLGCVESGGKVVFCLHSDGAITLRPPKFPEETELDSEA